MMIGILLAAVAAITTPPAAKPTQAERAEACRQMTLMLIRAEDSGDDVDGAISRIREGIDLDRRYATTQANGELRDWTLSRVGQRVAEVQLVARAQAYRQRNIRDAYELSRVACGH